MQDKESTVLKQVEAAIEHEAHLDLQSHPLALEFAGVPGVGGVIDRLYVDTGPSPGDGATRDAVCRWLLRDIDFQNCALYARVKGQYETLRAPALDGSGSIEVAVKDGVVTLSGKVISLSHKRLAGVLAWWARGCRDVVNAIEVVPPEDDNDDEIADALRLVLESDPYLHAERIAGTCRDHVVTLEGVVATEGERSRAEQDAWCLFAVDQVVNHIEVR